MSLKNENKKLNIIIGGVIGVAVFAGLVFLFAAIMLFFKIDRAYAPVFATVAVSAGGFAASFYTARKTGEKGYLIGALTGTGIFLILFLISLAFSKTSLSFNTLFHLLIIVLSSVIGGIWGVSKKKTKLL